MKNYIANIRWSDLDASRDIIADAIKKAEGRASVRCITPEMIFNALKNIDERIDLVSTKKDAVGTVVEVDYHAQTFPRAYKYNPESTHFSAVRISGGWRLLQVWRYYTESPNNAAIIQFTPETIANFAKHAGTMSAYDVR